MKKSTVKRMIEIFGNPNLEHKDYLEWSFTDLDATVVQENLALLVEFHQGVLDRHVRVRFDRDCLDMRIYFNRLYKERNRQPTAHPHGGHNDWAFTFHLEQILGLVNEMLDEVSDEETEFYMETACERGWQREKELAYIAITGFAKHGASAIRSFDTHMLMESCLNAH